MPPVKEKTATVYTFFEKGAVPARWGSCGRLFFSLYLLLTTDDSFSLPNKTRWVFKFYSKRKAREESPQNIMERKDVRAAPRSYCTSYFADARQNVGSLLFVYQQNAVQWVRHQEAGKRKGCFQHLRDTRCTVGSVDTRTGFVAEELATHFILAADNSVWMPPAFMQAKRSMKAEDVPRDTACGKVDCTNLLAVAMARGGGGGGAESAKRRRTAALARASRAGRSEGTTNRLTDPPAER